MAARKYIMRSNGYVDEPVNIIECGPPVGGVSKLSVFREVRYIFLQGSIVVNVVKMV